MTPKCNDTSSTPMKEPYTRQIQQDESASIAVVRTIATLRNSPADEIEPLADWLDPDALNEIIAHSEEATIKFEYAGLSVSVDRELVAVQDAAEN